MKADSLSATNTTMPRIAPCANPRDALSNRHGDIAIKNLVKKPSWPKILLAIDRCWRLGVLPYLLGKKRSTI
jgi:hypothetical protein